MARPRGYKRLTRKARHIIRNLRRTKYASVQDQMVHELRHEVSRAHGFRGPKKLQGRSSEGYWRPLTRKAKQILTRLRKAKVWGVQKRLVNELAREIEHGRRLADRARDRAQAAAARARASAARARAAGRGARRAGRATRAGVRRASERHLRRAERIQAERDAGRRGPPLASRARWVAFRNRPGRARGRRPAPARAPRPSRAPQARAPRPARAPSTSRSSRIPAYAPYFSLSSPPPRVRAPRPRRNRPIRTRGRGRA